MNKIVMYMVPYSLETVNRFFYSIYKYLPKCICRIISIFLKANIGGTQLRDRDPFLCDYVRPIGLLPMQLEQLLEKIELVPHHVLCAEVFRNHIGTVIQGRGVGDLEGVSAVT